MMTCSTCGDNWVVYGCPLCGKCPYCLVDRKVDGTLIRMPHECEYNPKVLTYSEMVYKHAEGMKIPEDKR